MISSYNAVSCEELCNFLHDPSIQSILVDCRSLLEFSTSRIQTSTNIPFSKLIKRKLLQEQISATGLLSACRLKVSDITSHTRIVVYEQLHKVNYSDDSFIMCLSACLSKSLPATVYLLHGGFMEFKINYPYFCESDILLNQQNTEPTSLSLPKADHIMVEINDAQCSHEKNSEKNVGPTTILPFLFLGSQKDAMLLRAIQEYEISRIINVSTTGAKPEFIQEGAFLRIPVDDSQMDRLLPYFEETFAFIENARKSQCKVLVHCLAGISRSATIAIAYIMKKMNIGVDEAYKYVKTKRPSISPNFNFLGQLYEFEQIINFESRQTRSEFNSAEDQIMFIDEVPPTIDPSLSAEDSIYLQNRPRNFARNFFTENMLAVSSPTVAFAKLNFASPVVEQKNLSARRPALPFPFLGLHPTFNAGDYCSTNENDSSIPGPGLFPRTPKDSQIIPGSYFAPKKKKVPTATLR